MAEIQATKGCHFLFLERGMLLRGVFFLEGVYALELDFNQLVFTSGTFFDHIEDNAVHFVLVPKYNSAWYEAQ